MAESVAPFVPGSPQPPQPMPLSDDDDEKSFVILGSCSSGEMDFPDDSFLSPLDERKLQEIRNSVGAELLQIKNAEAMSPSCSLNGDAIDLDQPSLAEVLTYEETQGKVDQLIKENNKLKETMVQNNLVLQSQFDKIDGWRQEVDRLYKTYKDKLMEAKAKIDQLSEDNAKLRSRGDKYKMIKEIQDEEFLKLKSQLAMQDNRQKTADDTQEKTNDSKQEVLNKVDEAVSDDNKTIDELQAKIESLELSSNYLKTENDLLVKKVQTTSEMEGELEANKEQCKSLAEALDVAEAEVARWTAKVKSLEECYNQLETKNNLLMKKVQTMSEMAEELKAKEEQCKSLAYDLDLAKVQVVNWTAKVKSLEESYNQSETKNNLLVKKVQTLSEIAEELQRKNGECEWMNKSLQQAESEVADRTARIRQLEQTVEQLKNERDRYFKLHEDTEPKVRAAADWKRELSTKRDECRTLTASLAATASKSAEKFKWYEEQLNTVKQSRDSNAANNAVVLEQRDQLREQLMATQIQVTKLEQTLIAKDAQIKKLQQELTALSASTDEIFALQAQLNLYRTDYESEVALKNTLRQEKDQLAEDLQNLLRRNQQLQEELELFRDRNFVVYPPSTQQAPSAPEAADSSSSPTFSRYRCPICASNFRSLKMVQEHVDSCLIHHAS